MQKFIKEEREKKVVENNKKFLELFKDEIEKQGATISYEIRYQDTHPKFYISGDISIDLKEKINAYLSNFPEEGFFD